MKGFIKVATVDRSVYIKVGSITAIWEPLSREVREGENTIITSGSELFRVKETMDELLELISGQTD